MSIRPLKDLEKVELDFEFDVSDEYIEQTIDEHGMQPSRRWAVSFDLAEVPAELRSGFRQAHRMYMAVEPYPVLPMPTDDPREFLAFLQPWLEEVKSEYEQEQELKRERERQQEIASARFRLEMEEWVQVHGSTRLRAAVEREYKANTTYAMERAASEMPEFWVDTADDAAWGERSDPSEEALLLESAVQKLLAEQELDLEVRIVWLIEPPRALERWLEDEFEAQEALVVFDYLGRYDLVMPIDEELRRPREDA